MKPHNQPTDGRTATDWLDHLSAGTCDQDAFLRGIGEILRQAPEEGWEILALLDQYYRRGKISADAFAIIKAQLQDMLMGTTRASEASEVTGEHSVPMPRAAARAPRRGAAAARATAARSAAATQAAGAARSGTQRLATRATSAPRAAPVSAAAAVSRSASVPITGPAGVRDLGIRTLGANALGVNALGVNTLGPNAPTQAMPQARETPIESTPDEPPQLRERSLIVGDVLRGRYRIEALLGQGGMGTVFAAVDEYRLDRSDADQHVAIKVLHTAVMQRPRLFAELRREFQHLQSLSHPNIVRVHEFDRDGDLAFFTMEYLSGALLSRVVAAHESSPLARSYAWAIVRDVGRAVAHAHSRGVVHGDLNPGNVFVTDIGELRVLDFGASLQLRKSPWISDFENSQEMTVATPPYASCQLLEGEAADARDDIYALACIAYVLLTGNHPFSGQSALKARGLGLRPQRPRGLTARQWHALRAGLQFDRAQRPAHVEPWLEQLHLGAAATRLPPLPALLKLHEPEPQSLRWILTAAAVALLIVGAGWGATHTAAVSAAIDAISSTVKTKVAAVQANDSGDSEAQPAAVAPDASLPRVAPAAPAAEPLTAAVQPAPASVPAPSTPAIAAIVPKASAAAAAVAAHPASPPPTPKAIAADAAAPAPFRARLELTADSVEVEPGDSVAHLVIRRTRAMRGGASFTWWTESGTAKPGRDFVPVKSHVEQMDDRRGTMTLAVPILADRSRREDRSFYVVIDQADESAAVGPRTLAMVTIGSGASE